LSRPAGQPLPGDHAPDGMGRGRHGVESHPVPMRELAHQQHIHPGAEIAVRHKGLIKSRRRPQSIEGFAQKDQAQAGTDLNRSGVAHQQKGRQIGEGELRQDIPQLKVQAAGADAVEADAENQQQQRAPQGVTVQLRPARAGGPALGDRKRYRHADDEHKKGLHEIPEMEAVPVVMLQLPADKAEKGAVESSPAQNLVKPGGFPD